MDYQLREQLLKLKVKAWAFALANEFGAVPNVTKLDEACEVFGSEYGPLLSKAMTSYEGYSDSDLSSSVLRELRNLEF
jgi:hypothetical protein